MELGSSRVQKLKTEITSSYLSTSCRGSPDLEFSAKGAKQKSEA